MPTSLDEYSLIEQGYDPPRSLCDGIDITYTAYKMGYEAGKEAMREKLYEANLRELELRTKLEALRMLRA